MARRHCVEHKAISRRTNVGDLVREVTIEDFTPCAALGKSKEIETPQNNQCASRNRRELCESREAGILRPRDGQNERKNDADQNRKDEKNGGGMFCRKSQSEGDGARDKISPGPVLEGPCGQDDSGGGQ
jgi:hypothetical protein